MTDKLTDKEIVKALEDLKKCNNNEIDCGNCALSKFYPRCPEEIGELALNLINRLQAENEELVGNADKLKAENERLENAYKQCAWERDIFAEDMKEEIKKDCSYLMLDIKTIKEQAYKEFAERLKERASRGFWETDDYIGAEQIDDLVKDLVEDKP